MNKPPPSKSRKALFLDRDGVINEDREYVYRPQDIVFRNGIFDLCRFFQERDYLLFVITNQSGIARGYFTEDQFYHLTDWMLRQFRDKEINIQKVYHCPYHPDYNLEEYGQYAEDRKPRPGMVLKAQQEFGLDLQGSILIGDKGEDIECGRNAGVGTGILVKSEYYKEGIPADLVVEKLGEVPGRLGLFNQ